MGKKSNSSEGELEEEGKQEEENIPGERKTNHKKSRKNARGKGE